MSIEFISYTGEYPCLCYGVLTLRINEEEIKFGGKDNNYERFWASGGTCNFCPDWTAEVNINPWIIKEEKLPEFLKPHCKELADLMNSNVEWGCCGGCL